jgi:hypothetical protein
MKKLLSIISLFALVACVKNPVNSETESIPESVLPVSTSSPIIESAETSTTTTSTSTNSDEGNSSDVTPVSVFPENANIVLDGIVDDASYDLIPEFKTGIKSSLTVRYAVQQSGLFMAFVINDSTYFKAANASGGLTASDYTGFIVDSAAKRYGPDGFTSNNDTKSEYTFLFRFDTSGRYTMARGNEYGGWVSPNFGSGTFANGTKVTHNTVEAAFHGEGEDGNGYSAEFYIPFALLETSEEQLAANNYQIMYWTEHNDTAVDICANANIDAPSNYNSLTLHGRVGTNKGLAAPEITLDGILDEELWTTADVTNEGNFKSLFSGETAGDFYSKAFFGANGLYIGINVVDPDLRAPNGTGPAYKNAGFELRLHVSKQVGATTNYKTDPAVWNGKWLFDIYGPQWHEGVSGGLSSSYAIYGEYTFDIRGTIDVTDDVDEGWGFEMYVPWSQLKMIDPLNYLHILNAVGTYEQHNALPQEYITNVGTAGLGASGQNTGWDYDECYHEMVRK